MLSLREIQWKQKTWENINIYRFKAEDNALWTISVYYGLKIYREVWKCSFIDVNTIEILCISQTCVVLDVDYYFSLMFESDISVYKRGYYCYLKLKALKKILFEVQSQKL